MRQRRRFGKQALLVCWLLLSTRCALAGEIRQLEIDGAKELTVYELSQGDTVARFCPEAGANLYSIKVAGTEFLRQPDSLAELAGVAYGTPILYPTPNRVKNARFSFADTVVQFEPNAGQNFIHGLVNRLRWDVVGSEIDPAGCSIKCLANFSDGTDMARRFPFPHKLYVTVAVAEGSVKWTYEVDNNAGQRAVPFGFALHPYFQYQGERAQTFVTIPATHWMESTAQLPSGRLLAADQLSYPLGEPLSLADTRLDDVFWGMQRDRPTIVDFRDVGRKIEIEASEQFTHLVVWTPDRPYFGIENQTCSTDAHNLHTAGHTEAAHLQICAPGEKMSGWVQYRFQ